MKKNLIVDTLSLPSLPAHTIKLCEPIINQLPEILRLDSFILSEIKYPQDFRLMVGLLLSSGLRITEMLNIKMKDIDSQGRIRIRSLKGSKKRLIQCVYHVDRLLHVRLHKNEIFESTNRFYLYREFKKNGFMCKSKTSKNHSVTHYFRYLYIYRMHNDGYSVVDIAEEIGHANVDNTLRYVKGYRPEVYDRFL
ncbi:MAG: site-specific integrase [Desulfobacterales bacterium]|nr:site-specific integrase [Desulfobacterales bacterium]